MKGRLDRIKILFLYFLELPGKLRCIPITLVIIQNFRAVPCLPAFLFRLLLRLLLLDLFVLHAIVQCTTVRWHQSKMTDHDKYFLIFSRNSCNVRHSSLIRARSSAFNSSPSSRLRAITSSNPHTSASWP